MSTLDRIQDIMRDLFDEDDLTISPGTTAEDVEDWDSMNHVRLIVEIERDFGIELPITEVNRLKNVGELIALIETTLNG